MKSKNTKLPPLLVTGLITISVLSVVPPNAHANDAKELLGSLFKGVLNELGNQNGARQSNRQRSQIHSQQSNSQNSRSWDDVARQHLEPREQQGIPYHHPTYSSLIGVYLNGKGQFSPAMDNKLRRILKTCCHDHSALRGEL